MRQHLRLLHLSIPKPRYALLQLRRSMPPLSLAPSSPPSAQHCCCNMLKVPLQQCCLACVLAWLDLNFFNRFETTLYTKVWLRLLDFSWARCQTNSFEDIAVHAQVCPVRPSAPVTHHNCVICHCAGYQRSGVHMAGLSVAHPLCGKVVTHGNWDGVHEPQHCAHPACQRVFGGDGNTLLTFCCFARPSPTHRHTDKTCQHTFAYHSVDMKKDMIYGCLT